MDNYKFPIVEEPIFRQNGEQIPKRKAIIRTDTSQTIAIVSNNYKLVPHSNVVDMFNGVPDMELKQVSVGHCGASLIGRYDFLPNIPHRLEVKVGDYVDFYVRVFNSYDTSLGVGFSIIGDRLVCKNGLITSVGLGTARFKHFESLDVNVLQKLVVEELNQVLAKMDGTWKQWLTTKPSNEKIQAFFKEVVDKYVGKKLLPLLEKDAIDKNQTDGMWGIYNVLSAHTSHNIKTKTPENQVYAIHHKESTLLRAFYRYQW